MPLILRESIENEGEIALWRVDETPDELISALRKAGIYADLPFFRNPGRLSEWLATRVLLSVLNVKQRIVYDENGKPHLEGENIFLSVSHSRNLIGVVLHKHHAVGIDVEHTGDRIFRVAHKFVNEHENQWLSEAYRMEQLYIIWGAKECAFKIYGLGNVDFKDHLFVSAFEMSPKGTTTVRFKKDNHDCVYQIFFQYLEQAIITYAIAL